MSPPRRLEARARTSHLSAARRPPSMALASCGQAGMSGPIRLVAAVPTSGSWAWRGLREHDHVALFRKRPTDTGTRFVVSGHRAEWLVATEHYPRVYARAREDQPVLVELVAE